jgi:hypothetical protein
VEYPMFRVSQDMKEKWRKEFFKYFYGLMMIINLVRYIMTAKCWDSDSTYAIVLDQFGFV